MFDIGFLEIIIIMVIALIVIGPERMPEVARKIGQFTGKTKRFINSMKEDSEISKTLHEIQDSVNLEEHKREIESVTNSLQEDLSRIENEWDVDIDQEISRPFERDETKPMSGNQFNKAPQQPVVPKPEPESEQISPTISETAEAESTQVTTEPSPAPQPEKA